MKYILFFLFILTSLSVFGQDPDQKSFQLREGSIAGKDYIPNVLIVKFRNTNKTLSQAAAVSSSISKAVELGQSLQIDFASINQVKALFPTYHFSPTVKKNEVTTLSSKNDTIGLDRIVEIKYSSDKGIEEVINELLKNPNIEYAEPRYIYRAITSPRRKYDKIPNDPDESTMQPYLQQVYAPDAWNALPVGPLTSVLIAIVDSGSQIDHPDLKDNIYINSKEIPNNGIDDERDGYIDNYYGWDFAGANGSSPNNNPNVLSVEAAHGVHVSGLASAVTNNAIGIASIAYNYAQLLIVKVGQDNPPYGITAGYEGIQYAVDHGAKVINCSWGGPSSGAYGQNIIDYAVANDCLVVVAAGNNDDVDNSPIDPNANAYPLYPAAYRGVFAVASVNSSNQKSFFSNYGPQIAIAAPGGDADAVDNSVPIEELLSTYYPSTYQYDAGTSMATPLVSSAAALVKAVYPSLTMRQVGMRLQATADNIDAQNPSFIGALGAGRLNVYRAVTEAVTFSLSTAITFTVQPLYPNPSGDFVNVDMNLPAPGPVSIKLYSMLGQVVATINANFQEGPQSTALDVSQLPSGIYHCTINYGSVNHAMKVEVSQ